MSGALKLRHVLFLLILLAGLVPLVVSFRVIAPTKEIMEDQERTDLTRTAERLSSEMNGYLAEVRRELEMIGTSILAPEGPAEVGARLGQDWVVEYLDRLWMQKEAWGWKALVVFDLEERGPRYPLDALSGELLAGVQETYDRALDTGRPQYRLVELPDSGLGVVFAVPVRWNAEQPDLVVEAAVPLPYLLPGGVVVEEATASEKTFLVDREGTVLWSSGASPALEEALGSSPVLAGFRQRPLALTEIYEITMGGETVEMIGIVSPIEETGWGVVVQKPASAAFVTARKTLITGLVSTAVLVVLAFLIAYLASSWIGQPIQRLAGTTHAIASGDFSSRVDTHGLRFEIADLAQDFNAMGGYLQKYVDQLKQAAGVNRELFIGSLRAFTAAIDAKDPYTRGHSERVASLARTIARYLGQPEEFQKRLWIAALLHDVGKIGVEDRILRKGGVLTPEEYEQMKMHTVIGADIISPIDALREAVPVVRWHHENWNGRGYPDGIKGEQIPLMARIVAVADTFDAITTNRPYQKAYDLSYAVETITKLTGARFDAKIVTAFLRAVQKKDLPFAVRTAEPESAPQAAAAG